MTPTHEYLAEQKRLAEGATEGPWEYSPTILGLPNTTILAPASGEHVSYVALAHAAEQNAAFIAAARSSVPRMIAALEAVRGILAPHVEYQLRREAKFGRNKPSCICEQCQAWLAIEAELIGGEGE